MDALGAGGGLRTLFGPERLVEMLMSFDEAQERRFAGVSKICSKPNLE
jgi:hypothetical protein